MDFAFSQEHEQLRATVRAFLAQTSPESEVRRLMDDPAGFDPGVWRRMATELGLQGLAIPEEYGGAGCGMVEVGLVLEEMGRALLCAPYLSSAVLATTALIRCADEPVRKRLLPALADGRRIGTFALTEDSDRWDRAGVALRATPAAGGRWRLTGHKNFVLDGAAADFVLTVAAGPDGIGLFLVDGDAPGLTRAPLPTLDPTRRQARLEYRDVLASKVAHDGAGDGWALVAAVLDRAAVALAAEQIGVAAQALDTAVEYAKTRRQFGRPIGSFQAVKHLLADVSVEVESARAAAHFAMLSADGDDDDDGLSAVASLAKAFCSDACLTAALENVQVHGGIGFTWEHSAHLYLKRAKTSQLMFGDPAYHRESIARRLIGEPA
ncbi:MAG: acyl-CoA/acyl-ACP dehydrogenase [Streptomyces sp.]|nr:acyl-CoA/acyl-ACP dehydrogenase [Streptomyces sp.]